MKSERNGHFSVSALISREGQFLLGLNQARIYRDVLSS